MRFLDVGDTATGFIAVGQHATGVIAIGQHATGIIAIGQVARGCIAIGQAAIGFIGWGQVGLGLLHAVGMLGAGGRGFGIVLRLTPSLGKKRVPPEVSDYSMIMQGNPGWLEAELAHDAYGTLGLFSSGHRLPAKFDRKIARASSTFARGGSVHVWAFLHREADTLVCTRIAYIPARPFTETVWYWMFAFQFLGLVMLATAWWFFVGADLMMIVAQS